MRNLVILSSQRLQSVFASNPQDKFEATAASVDDDTAYAVGTSKSSTSSADVRITFYVKELSDKALSSFSSLLVPAALPPLAESSSDVCRPVGVTPEVVSFHYLSDGGQEASNQPALCTVTAGGDILLLPLDIGSAGNSMQPQIVGSIEQGISAACWSSDDELLVIVTSETASSISVSGSREGEKVLVMTRDFEVLSERPLQTDEFGEDAAVDVGWGSKATQFHGSEGKAAAARAAEISRAAKESRTDTRGPPVLDDDGRPRISWRGDGAFFAISSLESSKPRSSQEQHERTWHRVIRIYARTGALSATSDAAIRGISQALAFRPVGNLIATTQRFGPSPSDGQPWAQGRTGRHDVVFFERNGLRHGEFSLREEAATQPEGKQIAWTETQTESTWFRNHRVRDINWNADGSALAVWLSRTDTHGTIDVDVVQIFTTGNYHWYLKQELVFRTLDSQLNQVKWNVEDPLQCSLVFDNGIERIQFHLDTATSGGKPPHDAAYVTVADGAASLLTPFRLQKVPPPMCASSLLLPPATQYPVSTNASVAVPAHYAWTQLSFGPQQGSSNIMGVLFRNGIVQIWQMTWGPLDGKPPVGGHLIHDPVLLSTVQMSATATYFNSYQLALVGWSGPALHDTEDAKISLAVLSSKDEGAEITVAHITRLKGQDGFTVSLQESVGVSHARNMRLLAEPFIPQSTSAPKFFLHAQSGSIEVLEHASLQPVLQLERFCPDLRLLAKVGGQQSVRVVALAPNGRLYANTQLVAKDATSFVFAGSFLVWTNTHHQARFIPLASLTFATASSTEASSESIDLGRKVERGSRIVTAVPSLMALILQMPRGNLETICPRPLVLEVVRRNLDNRRYGAAFRICRTHRLDVNILYDHDPVSFMTNIGSFVRQVKDVDHINLFLSGLRNEDVNASLYKPAGSVSILPSEAVTGKVNRICDAMRDELVKAGSERYIHSILTTHVRKVPADYEAGLTLLLQLKEKDHELAEAAVKYIIFLADADKLFGVALGMYDFPLTLMVAQHAQRKDPREYLPFLRDLRALSPPEYQKYKIDDHLQRHAKALAWLSKAGSAHHAEVLQYTQKHKLFHQALNLYCENAASSAASAARLRDVYALFGNYLLTRRKYDDAGMMLQLAHENRNAIDAYRMSQNWREVLRLAITEKLPASEIVIMAKELIDELEVAKKYTDASRIALDYLRDVEQSVRLLCKDNKFAEAGRVLQMQSRMDLMSTTFNPSMSEAVIWLLDEASDIDEQLEKQLTRIGELRIKKEREPNGFYGEDDPALDNIDVMSDTSTQMTQFTRYTTTASIATQSSLATFSTKSGSRKKEAKLKKKQERKKAGGKKGSVYEEDYLYMSITKLLNERLDSLQEETSKVLPHLAVSPSSTLRAKAVEVHNAIEALEGKAQNAVAKLWSYSQEDDNQRFKALVQFEADILSGSLASNPTLAAMTLRQNVNRPLPRPRITVADRKWRNVLLDEASADE